MPNRKNLSIFQNAIKSWVTETNLLKECSETLPDVTDYFNVFKHKFKFNIIGDFSLVSFLQEFYPKFEFQSEDHHILCQYEHIYVFSLLLHFSCVAQMDPFFQKACLTVCHSYQEVIHKFLNILIERQLFDKESLSVIMNEASMSFKLAPLKIQPHMQSGTTPPTPKSKMLDSKMYKIRCLEAKLESERQRNDDIETEFQEKLRQKQSEIDDLVKEKIGLQREILEKESEMASFTCDREVDKACQNFMDVIAEKDQIIIEIQSTIHSLNAENEELSQKLCESNMTVTKHLQLITELEDTVHSLEEELERQSVKNCALENHVTGLNSFIVNSRRLDESLSACNFFDSKDFLNNNNNNSLADSSGTETSPISPVIVKTKRSFSVDTHAPIPILFQRNRKNYRSTTYKESERHLSIADEFQATAVISDTDKEKENDDKNSETQLSNFFDSLYEGRRESVPIILTSKPNLSCVMEDDGDTENNHSCSILLAKLEEENENLRKANEKLALAQLANRRPKRGFKICVIS